MATAGETMAWRAHPIQIPCSDRFLYVAQPAPRSLTMHGSCTVLPSWPHPGVLGITFEIGNGIKCGVCLWLPVLLSER